MKRMTIGFGIDLGTTNSAIAVLRGIKPDVIANSKSGATFTPSVVWVDKRNTLRVGDDARQQLFGDDSENVSSEFKLQMGRGNQAVKIFPRSGREMLPEELSAEVLKELKLHVRVSTKEEIDAAVITVPAAFELPSCDATRKAAQLAGFRQCALLQEPIAAALAYGFQEQSDNVYWLVYDFGGGTFDAAVIQVRDGAISVVNHAGDNNLGGKNIDWDIVDKYLIPALTRKFKIAGFSRSNANINVKKAIAKLKYAAEASKIQVSKTEAPADIWIDNLCQDDTGEMIDFNYMLTPQELCNIIHPYILRTIDLCKKALEEKSLSGTNMQKILLVGGSSLFPWLQAQLQKELATKIDCSVDPMTVVAQGAAIFADTQKYESDPTQEKLDQGKFKIDLKYEPIGADTNPLIGGQIIHPQNKSLMGYTLEVREPHIQWRSGKITLDASGKFCMEIHAEKGRKNEYQFDLCDTRGTKVITSPDGFAYTVGVTITSAPMIHSIGVAMANNDMDIFIEKGAPLPANKRVVHKTVELCKAGQNGKVIKIPVVEGEHKRADRNRLIGSLVIPATKIKRDLPSGSEVEITIDIDESRLVTTSTFIPFLDQTFSDVIQLEMTSQSQKELVTDLDKEKTRLDSIRKDIATSNNPDVQQSLRKLEDEQVVSQTENLINAAGGNQDNLRPAQNRLLDLKAGIDEMEDALALPRTIKEAEGKLINTRELVNRKGTSEDKETFEMINSETQKAIKNTMGTIEMRCTLLRQRIEMLDSLYWDIELRGPEIWIYWLKEDLPSKRSLMTDQAMADDLFSQGERAININDLEGLKSSVRQLLRMVPREFQPVGWEGGTQR
jgi:molecular chaperone DnaK